MLESLSADFSLPEQFNDFIPNKRSGFRSYYLPLGDDEDDPVVSPYVVYTDDKVVRIVSTEGIRLLLPTDVKCLQIQSYCIQACLCDGFSTIGGNNEPRPLRICEISDCRDLMYVFCLSRSCSFCGSLQSLDTLHLSDLASLQCLHEFRFEALPIRGPFSSLRYFSANGCNKIKNLLTPKMTAQLRHLKQLAVHSCNSMEQIFSADEEEDGNHSEIINISGITLPSLESVILYNLPVLNRVCTGVLICESLQAFTIACCPSLEQEELPRLQPAFKINFEI